jgi:Recombination directionality factor-like
MPIIDLQRRLLRTGAIRLGNKLVKKDSSGRPVLDRKGYPVMYPNKLDTFRITSPHREIADAVAERFGGQVLSWQGPKGPEWEVITTCTKLPVFVPKQIIDPNYEFWGNKIKVRFCDGTTERIRGVPCLCQRWDNHEHRYNQGRCQFCGLDQKWQGEPHVHEFDQGECVICGCRRLCKPTIRVNVLIQGIPGIGVFKVESHGINAAIELPTLAEMISSTPIPLPAILGMRFEERSRMTKAGEIEIRKFYVPELRFPWATPELMFADSPQLERAARQSLPATVMLQAIGAAPELPDQADEATQLTREDILNLIITASKVDTIRGLWADASKADCLDVPMRRLLADRAKELKLLEELKSLEGQQGQEEKTRPQDDKDDVLEAEIVED